jgi:esterase
VDLAGVAREVLSAAGAAGLGRAAVAGGPGSDDSSLGEARFALVGHSLGGKVGLAAAAQAPERLSEIVLLDIAPGATDPPRLGSARVLDILQAAPEQAPDRRSMREFLLGRGLSAPLADWLLMNLEPADGGYRWRFDRAALAAFHDRFNREDLWPVVEARRLPIRCIRGGRSNHVTDADVARFRAAGCRVDTIPDSGHDVHAEALDPLLALLTT